MHKSKQRLLPCANLLIFRSQMSLHVNIHCKIEDMSLPHHLPLSQTKHLYEDHIGSQARSGELGKELVKGKTALEEKRR